MTTNEQQPVITLPTVGKLQRFCHLAGLTYRFAPETAMHGRLYRDGRPVGFFHLESSE